MILKKNYKTKPLIYLSAFGILQCILIDNRAPSSSLVRTSAFQTEYTGSNPVGATK